MAPGSVSKASAPEPYHSPEPASAISESAEVGTLNPKVQRLIKEFDNLPWFERTFGFKAPIVWFNVYVAVLGHLLALYGAVAYGPKACWTSWVFYLFLYLFSGLGVTAGVHRYWSTQQ